MRTKVGLLLTTLLLTLSLSDLILAQQQEKPGGGEKGGDQGRQSPAPHRGRARTYQSPDQMRMTVRLRGTVVLDDGSPLPGSVRVELVCFSSVRQQANTFGEGSFSFEVGAHSGMAFADASVGGIGGNPESDGTPRSTFGRRLSSQPGFDSAGGSMNLAGCELRALLPGFQSDRVQLGLRRPLDNSEVGPIVLSRLDKVAGSTVSFASLSAPKKARKDYEKAKKELRKKKVKYSKVTQELEKAVKLYPKYATAWNLLGTIRLRLKDEEGARKAFQQAIESDSKYVRPYLSLAMLEGQKNRWQEVARLTDRVLELNPYIGQAHYFSAVANFKLGNLDLAEQFILEYRKHVPSKQPPQSFFLAGSIFASKGNYTSAATEFRQFLKRSPEDQRGDQVRQQLLSWKTQGLIESVGPIASSNEQSKLRQ